MSVQSFHDLVADGAQLAAAAESEDRARTVERWLMLGVSGQAVVQQSFVDDAEVSQSVFQRLLRAEPPQPKFEAGERTYPQLDDASRTAPLSTCLSCAVTPGEQQCRACGGRGSIRITDDRTRRCECNSGKVPCSSCDGTKESYTVRIHYHRDVTTSFAHVFLPHVSPGLQRALVNFLRTRSNVPAFLDIDLADDYAMRDAYRGRAGDEEWQGHRIGNVLSVARRYVQRISNLPSVRTIRHRTCVWPIAMLEGVSTLAQVVDEKGRLLTLRA